MNQIIKVNQCIQNSYHKFPTRLRKRYQFTYVMHVSATNMKDFYVLGSNQSFPSSLPGPMVGNGYQMCGQYSGTPPVGQISRITCQPQPITTRFVYIQVDRSADPSIIELCEVWVFGSKCELRSSDHLGFTWDFLSSWCHGSKSQVTSNDDTTHFICVAKLNAQVTKSHNG